MVKIGKVKNLPVSLKPALRVFDCLEDSQNLLTFPQFFIHYLQEVVEPSCSSNLF